MPKWMPTWTGESPLAAFEVFRFRWGSSKKGPQWRSWYCLDEYWRVWPAGRLVVVRVVGTVGVITAIDRPRTRSN